MLEKVWDVARIPKKRTLAILNMTLDILNEFKEARVDYWQENYCDLNRGKRVIVEKNDGYIELNKCYKLQLDKSGQRVIEDVYPLFGEALLDRVKNADTSDNLTLARECGYLTQSPEGFETIQLTEFFEALIEARDSIN